MATPTSSDGWISVARLVVPAAGRVRVGVALAPGVTKAIGSVRVGGAIAQADNPVFDRDGWLRWFLLSAIRPASDQVVEISAVRVAGEPLAGPAPQVTISRGEPVAPEAPRSWLADWRRGPVVTESVWRLPLGGDGLRADVHESVWSDGAGSSTVVVDNGFSVPGRVTARTRRYNIVIARGSQRLAYSGIVHVPYTRFVRRLGSLPVHAMVVPLSGGSPWDHFRAARALQNFADAPAFSTAAIDALSDQPFAVTDANMIGVAKRAQGSPGADADIGQHPAYLTGWLHHFSPATARAIRRQTDARQGAPYFYRLEATGAAPRPDQGVEYGVGGAQLGMRAPDDTERPNQTWTPSHWGAMFRIPYLLWGELTDLEGQIAQVGHSHASTFPDTHGRGMNRHVLYWADLPPWWVGHTNTFIGGQGMVQLRTMGWGVRTTVHALACLPSDDDRVRALFGWDKSTLRRVFDNACARARKIVEDATGPASERIVQGFGIQDPRPHKYFDADGVTFPPGYFGYKHWMWAYVLTSMAHGIELGEVSPAGIAWWRRQMQTPVQVLGSGDADTAVVISIDQWPKVVGAFINGERIGVRPDASGQPIRDVRSLLENIRAGGFIGSRENDWAGNYYALAAFARDHNLPGAARAFAWSRGNIRPNPNHRIEPR